MTNYQWDRSAEGALGAQSDGPGYFCGHKLAGWGWRMLGAIIDYGLFFVLPYGCLGGGRLAWFLAVTLTLGNSGLLAAYTSQSLGKRLLGMNMVWVKRTANRDLYVVAVPWYVGLIRVPIHYLDFACCGIGLVIPLVSKSHCTIADFMCRTMVFRDPNLPSPESNVTGTLEWI